MVLLGALALTVSGILPFRQLISQQHQIERSQEQLTALTGRERRTRRGHRHARYRCRDRAACARAVRSRPSRRSCVCGGDTRRAAGRSRHRPIRSCARTSARGGNGSGTSSPGATSTRMDDRGVVEAQIGRPPRSLIDVAQRCHLDLPVVITVPPLLDDGTPFPTLYWLTCPLASKRIGRIEAAGGVRTAEQMLADDPDARVALTTRRWIGIETTEMRRFPRVPGASANRRCGGNPRRCQVPPRPLCRHGGRQQQSDRCVDGRADRAPRLHADVCRGSRRCVVEKPRLDRTPLSDGGRLAVPSADSQVSAGESQSSSISATTWSAMCDGISW